MTEIICALDMDKMIQVERLLQKLGKEQLWYKVGLKLYSQYGSDLIKFLNKKKKKIFLDLKLYDIPNTVAEAVKVATRLKVQMMTLHASGGIEMMSVAKQVSLAEAKKMQVPAPLLLGVTVLTSFKDLSHLGLKGTVTAQVLHLAQLAKKAKMDGVVCSPLEIKTMRKTFPKNFTLVTPGIRPLGSSQDDQTRIMTPKEAAALGSDFLVIGRPLWQAKDPLKVLHQIKSSLLQK